MQEHIQEDVVEVACWYAIQFAGLPYIWGGNNPLEGFDCSGFAQEILASMGLDPRGDQTAQGLYDHFSDEEEGQLCDEPEAGCLAFYGKPERITHVAFCLNEYQMIEAGGGGPACVDAKSAAANNAYVRIRPILARKDLIACIYPFPGL
jgi:cell wall-associated NlpC family hydrolase